VSYGTLTRLAAGGGARARTRDHGRLEPGLLIAATLVPYPCFLHRHRILVHSMPERVLTNTPRRPKTALGASRSSATLEVAAVPTKGPAGPSTTTAAGAAGKGGWRF
jgi:hypothetical protein